MAAPMRSFAPHFTRKIWNLSGTVRCIQKTIQCSFYRCMSTVPDETPAPPSGQSVSLAERFKQAARGTASRRHVVCRTTEDDPAKHRDAHMGMFYTVPQDHLSKWLDSCFRNDYSRVMKAFNECCLMVRQPAVEIIDFLSRTDYRMPVIRYVLHGRYGSGKSFSMAHVIHYAATQGWVIVHVPWAPHLNRYAKEMQESVHKEGRIDLPMESAAWLAKFSRMNGHLFDKLDLKTCNRYVWSRREVSEVGTPWSEMIDFGLARMKYASDILGALLKEIREQSTNQKFKTLVAVDGVNSFWQETHLKRPENKAIISAHELSMVHNFKKMLRNDWTGGAVVMTVDSKAGEPGYTEKPEMPRFLLGKEGFEWVDPYIPIQVVDYSDKEVHSCLDYYMERNWIQLPQALTDEGRKEIIFLSSKNPYELYRRTATY